MRKQWTETDINFLKQNYGLLSLNEISEKLNTTTSSVKRKAQREGIMSPRCWTEQEIQYLKDNYKTKTYKELSQALNRTKTAIDLKINRLGLKKSKYTYNHDYFENIDTQDKAYWLGFIYADGCVSVNTKTNSGELSIQLQDGDYKHLKKFNKAIQGNLEVERFRETCNLNNKTYPCCRIRLYSIKMAQDLISHGACPNKTTTITLPDIDEKLMSHFVRGFFDGDGCIVCNRQKNGKKFNYNVRCDFTSGSPQFLEQLRQVLFLHNIKSHVRKNSTNVYRLYIGGMQNCDNFLNYIYKDATTVLDRKYYKKLFLYKELQIEQRLLRLSEKRG